MSSDKYYYNIVGSRFTGRKILHYDLFLTSFWGLSAEAYNYLKKLLVPVDYEKYYSRGAELVEMSVSGEFERDKYTADRLCALRNIAVNVAGAVEALANAGYVRADFKNLANYVLTRIVEKLTPADYSWRVKVFYISGNCIQLAKLFFQLQVLAGQAYTYAMANKLIRVRDEYVVVENARDGIKLGYQPWEVVVAPKTAQGYVLTAGIPPPFAWTVDLKKKEFKVEKFSKWVLRRKIEASPRSSTAQQGGQGGQEQPQ